MKRSDLKLLIRECILENINNPSLATPLTSPSTFNVGENEEPTRLSADEELKLAREALGKILKEIESINGDKDDFDTINNIQIIAKSFFNKTGYDMNEGFFDDMDSAKHGLDNKRRLNKPIHYFIKKGSNSHQTILELTLEADSKVKGITSKSPIGDVENAILDSLKSIADYNNRDLKKLS